jgi:hypothetical protein
MAVTVEMKLGPSEAKELGWWGGDPTRKGESDERRRKKEGDGLNALAARQKWRKDTTTTT